MSALVFVVLLASWVAAGPVRAETFAQILGTSVARKIGEALSNSVARSIPVTSASAGVVFRFDPATGAFERETSILGQLFLERADPVGRHHLNVSLTYERVTIDTFEGKDIQHLRDTNFPIVDPDTGNPVRFPRFGIDLDTDVLTASATYGLTDDLDLSVTVPILYSDFALHIVQFSTAGEMRADVSSSKTGVGPMPGA